jgi:hypothetical protein
MLSSSFGLTDTHQPHHAPSALAVAICYAMAPPLMKAVG